MTKLEKVINGLEHCTGEVIDAFVNECSMCPYKPTNDDEKDCVGRTQKDALELLKERQWILVDERLPAVNEKVLICAKDRNNPRDDVIAITSMSDVNPFWTNDKVDPYWRDPWQYFSTMYEITHWMPLPEPPNEEDV